MSDRAVAWAQATLRTTSLTPQPLKAEASFRAFYRIECLMPDTGDPGSVVLMVSPPEKEQNAQFERLARVFGHSGLPVPAVLSSNPEEGWYLLSDVGRMDLEAVYGTEQESEALELAIETLIRLQRVRDPAIPPYTTQRFTDELGIFREWFVEKLLKARLPEPVEAVFHTLVERTRSTPQCCVHRDYHCRNLLYDPACRQLGIVDFQDALMGPVGYDLASLLHDCYHEFTDADVQRWINFYLSSTDLDLDPVTFPADVDHLAVQRQLKAVGIFARLRLRDAKTTHLAHILPVLDHLQRLTPRYAPLEPLARWLKGLNREAIAGRLTDLAAS